MITPRSSCGSGWGADDGKVWSAVKRAEIREAVRAVLLVPDGRILLLEYQRPRERRALWLTPGGGLKHGESPDEALRREVEEETGLAGFEVGPLLWRRTWRSKHFSQNERFYLIEASHFEPSAERMGKKERGLFRSFRWWHAREITLATGTFAPASLDEHLADLLTHGPPQRPIEVA